MPGSKAIQDPCHLALPLLGPSTLELQTPQQVTASPGLARISSPLQAVAETHQKHLLQISTSLPGSDTPCSSQCSWKAQEKLCFKKPHSKMFQIFGYRFSFISELPSHTLSHTGCWLWPGRCDTSASPVGAYVCLLWVRDHNMHGRAFSASVGSACKIIALLASWGLANRRYKNVTSFSWSTVNASC